MALCMPATIFSGTLPSKLQLVIQHAHKLTRLQFERCPRCYPLPHTPYMATHVRERPYSVCYLSFLEEFFQDGARIEAAFRKYFHRASPEQEEDSYEIIVGHANVIRYFVCRYVGVVVYRWVWLWLYPGGCGCI